MDYVVVSPSVSEWVNTAFLGLTCGILCLQAFFGCPLLLKHYKQFPLSGRPIILVVQQVLFNLIGSLAMALAILLTESTSPSSIFQCTGYVSVSLTSFLISFLLLVARSIILYFKFTLNRALFLSPSGHDTNDPRLRIFRRAPVKGHLTSPIYWMKWIYLIAFIFAIVITCTYPVRQLVSLELLTLSSSKYILLCRRWSRHQRTISSSCRTSWGANTTCIILFRS